MSRKSVLPQSPHHILVYDEDWEFLKQVYGPQGENPIGISPAIRALIHTFVNRLKARTEQVLDASASPGLKPSSSEEIVNG